MLSAFTSGLVRASPIVLSLLRIVTALVLLEHGTQKMFDFPSMPRFAGPPGAAAAGGGAGPPGRQAAQAAAQAGAAAAAGPGPAAPATSAAAPPAGSAAAGGADAAQPPRPGAAPGLGGGPRGGPGGGFAPPYPLWLMPIAGWIETIAGSLLVLGLFSRPAAFLLSGETAVIYFIAHAPMSFFPATNGGEPAVLFAWTFLYVFFAGPGPISLDWLWRRMRLRSPKAALPSAAE